MSVKKEEKEDRERKEDRNWKGKERRSASHP